MGILKWALYVLLNTVNFIVTIPQIIDEFYTTLTIPQARYAKILLYLIPIYILLTVITEIFIYN